MLKPRQEGPHGTPKFLELLSKEDWDEYENLQRLVGSPNNRYNRNRRYTVLTDIFERIRVFCERNDQDDWKRCLACGICWLEDGLIAINTNQLKVLISKCKSSINGALDIMGYETLPQKAEQYKLLKNKIPILIRNFGEIRHWTIRQCFHKKSYKEQAIEAKHSEDELKDSDTSPDTEENDFDFHDNRIVMKNYEEFDPRFTLIDNDDYVFEYFLPSPYDDDDFCCKERDNYFNDHWKFSSPKESNYDFTDIYNIRVSSDEINELNNRILFMKTNKEIDAELKMNNKYMFSNKDYT